MTEDYYTLDGWERHKAAIGQFWVDKEGVFDDSPKGTVYLIYNFTNGIAFVSSWYIPDEKPVFYGSRTLTRYETAIGFGAVEFDKLEKMDYELCASSFQESLNKVMGAED